MINEVSLVLSPKQASSEAYYISIVAQKLKVSPKRISHIQIKNRSIDARGKKVKVQLRALVYIDEAPVEEAPIAFDYKNVSHKPSACLIWKLVNLFFLSLFIKKAMIVPIIVI